MNTDVIGAGDGRYSAVCWGYVGVMLLDVLIALIIVVVAVALGLTVHPLFWLIVILAAFWMFGRRGTRRRVY